MQLLLGMCYIRLDWYAVFVFPVGWTLIFLFMVVIYECNLVDNGYFISYE